MRRSMLVRRAAMLAAGLLLGVLPMRVEAVNSELFSPYTSTVTGSFAEAVAVGDVNGDGFADVVLTTSFYFDPAHDFKLYVFLQQPDGQLAPPVLYPTNSDDLNRANSVQIGDVNGDGRQDIVLGNTSNIEVFLQRADGTLAPSVVYATPMARIIRVGDVNNDGRADVVGLDWSSNNVAVFLQNAGGTLDPAVMYIAPHGGYNDLGLGDVNGDSLTDIVVMSGQQFLIPNVVVLTQAATGGFNAPVSYSVASGVLSHGVAVGDVNGDGLNDIVVTYGGNQPSSKIGVFYQNAAGGLNPVVSFDSLDIPRQVEIADVDRDGRADIIVLHAWARVGVYLQNADGSLQAEELYFSPSGSYQPQALSVGDFNGDGVPDIAVADYNFGLVTLMHTASADVVTTAFGNPNPVVAGDTLTYSVSIGNHGPDAARNVVVSASVPSGVTVASTTPGCTVSGGTWQCTLLRVDAGATSPELQLAVQPNAPGTLVFSVSAASNASDPYSPNNTASVTTNVLNQAPVANAGPDRTVRHNIKTVTLDGTASYDSDGTIVSYQWRQVSGHAVNLSNASSAQASISIHPGISPLPSMLVFELTVTDNAGAAASDTVTITVTR